MVSTNGSRGCDRGNLWAFALPRNPVSEFREDSDAGRIEATELAYLEAAAVITCEC